jgi:hypothetical protein
MGPSVTACSRVRVGLTPEQTVTLGPFGCSGDSSKSGGAPKRRKGPPPDVLRKSGAHKDKKRRTGREPIRRDDLDDKADK